jgi:hypothetical protein
MGIFGEREPKPPTVCNQCYLKALAIEQLRKEKEFLKERVASQKEMVASLRGSLQTLQSVIDTLSNARVEPTHETDSQALRRAQARMNDELETAAGEDEETLPIDGLQERIDEVHLGGWAAPDSEPPGNIFEEIAPPPETTDDSPDR